MKTTEGLIIHLPVHIIISITRFIDTSKGSFTLLRSRAERSKDRNEATAVTTNLQRSNASLNIH